ncbi:MAG: aromatic acid exporter family protein [Oscillospiraceae bacterium]
MRIDTNTNTENNAEKEELQEQNVSLPPKAQKAATPRGKATLPTIGMRNVKTAISATACAIIYAIIGRNPTFACIGAVFGMDNTMPSSLKTGGNRLVGTVIGGFIGMGLFALSSFLPYRNISRLVLLFVGIIALIYISQLLHFNGAIQAGAVVFYIVMLNTPENSYISYALNRMLDTGIGVMMSVFINWVHIKLPIYKGSFK